MNTPAPIKAILKIITDPNDPNSGIPAVGKTIKFNVLSFASFSSLSSSSGITDSNGECSVDIKISRCVKSSIEGTFKNNPDDPNITSGSYSASCESWKDNFDSYKSSWPDNLGDDINFWIEEYWADDPNVTNSSLNGESHLDNGALMLYGRPCTQNQDGAIKEDGSKAYAFRQLQLGKFTIKFKIKNGNEKLYPDYINGSNNYRGMVGIASAYNYVHPFIIFAENNKIMFDSQAINAPDVTYENNRWYSVEIDYAIKFENDGSTWGHYYGILTYRIFDDSQIQIVNYSTRRSISNWENSYTGYINSNLLALVSGGGSVWFDDVEITSD